MRRLKIEVGKYCGLTKNFSINFAMVFDICMGGCVAVLDMTSFWVTFVLYLLENVSRVVASKSSKPDLLRLKIELSEEPKIIERKAGNKR
jgi:hypothetical protein